MARKPYALRKERLTIELDKELYKSWCSIGTALNLFTNSQIAQHLVLCYRSHGQSENTCKTCGAILTRYCTHCTNGKYSQNTKFRKQPRGKGVGKNNTPNTGQTVHSLVTTESATVETNTVNSDLDWVKNELVDDVAGEQPQQCCVNIASEIDGGQNMQHREQRELTIKMESPKDESDTVHSDSEGTESEPVDIKIEVIDDNIDHDQTQQCCVEMLLSTITDTDFSPSSMPQAKDCEENLVNFNSFTETSTPLPSTAHPTDNAKFDKVPCQTPKSGKTNAQRCYEYRQAVIMDPQKAKKYRLKYTERNRRYKERQFSEEESMHQKELARLRQKRYREKKAIEKAVERVAVQMVNSTNEKKRTHSTNKEQESQRDKWRDRQRKHRATWSQQKRARHREKALEYYYRNKAKGHWSAPLKTSDKVPSEAVPNDPEVPAVTQGNHGFEILLHQGDWQTGPKITTETKSNEDKIWRQRVQLHTAVSAITDRPMLAVAACDFPENYQLKPPDEVQSAR